MVTFSLWRWLRVCPYTELFLVLFLNFPTPLWSTGDIYYSYRLSCGMWTGRAGLCFPPFSSRKSAAKVVQWCTESWGSHESQLDVLKENVQLWDLVQARALLFPSPCSSFPQPLTLILEVVPLSDCPSVLLEVILVRLVGVRLTVCSLKIPVKRQCWFAPILSADRKNKEELPTNSSTTGKDMSQLFSPWVFCYCCYIILFWRQGFM